MGISISESDNGGEVAWDSGYICERARVKSRLYERCKYDGVSRGEEM
jgi:hypothetical protein